MPMNLPSLVKVLDSNSGSRFENSPTVLYCHLSLLGQGQGGKEAGILIPWVEKETGSHLGISLRWDPRRKVFHMARSCFETCWPKCTHYFHVFLSIYFVHCGRYWGHPHSSHKYLLKALGLGVMEKLTFQGVEPDNK